MKVTSISSNDDGDDDELLFIFFVRVTWIVQYSIAIELSPMSQ